MNKLFFFPTLMTRSFRFRNKKRERRPHTKCHYRSRTVTVAPLQKGQKKMSIFLSFSLGTLCFILKKMILFALSFSPQPSWSPPGLTTRPDRHDLTSPNWATYGQNRWCLTTGRWVSLITNTWRNLHKLRTDFWRFTFVFAHTKVKTTRVFIVVRQKLHSKHSLFF